MVIIGLSGQKCAGKNFVSQVLQGMAFELINIKEMELNEIQNIYEIIKCQIDRNYVLFPVLSTEIAEIIKNKPRCLILYVDAPFSRRWKNYSQLHGEIDLEEFLQIDKENFSTEQVAQIADIRIENTGEQQQLEDKIMALQLCDADLLRPTWDSYFIRLAELAALRSNWMKRAVGAVVIKNNRTVSTGYNGTPRRVPNWHENGCPRCNACASSGTALEACMCIHAEENAILEAGLKKCSGGTIYTTTYPCLFCTKSIVQVGIKRVVYTQEFPGTESSLALMTTAGVIIEKHLSWQSPNELGRISFQNEPFIA